MVVGVAGAMAVMVWVTLAPLARVGITGHETVLVVGLYVPPGALINVKPGGRIS